MLYIHVFFFDAENTSIKHFDSFLSPEKNPNSKYKQLEYKHRKLLNAKHKIPNTHLNNT